LSSYEWPLAIRYQRFENTYFTLIQLFVLVETNIALMFVLSWMQIVEIIISL